MNRNPKPMIPPSCHPHHHVHFGDINYSAEQINALLGMIPHKADRKELFPNNSYLGHFPTKEDLPNVNRFAWAFVGSLESAHPFFFYTKESVPKGYTEGWNDMTIEFGTYPIAPDIPDQITAEELFRKQLRLPQLTADRAIADEHGNRISDTYVTRRSVEGHIKQIYNQQFIENPPLITEGYITPEMLSEETREMLEATGQSITNLPDGEDLQAVHGVLKLANKKYNPNSFSGLGRQYLRKNIVAGVNILTQSMMQWTNTIYIIQYDYDLQGKEITIPAGCVLDFQGGSLSNGSLIFTKTFILNSSFTNVRFSGTLKNERIDIELLGAKSNDALFDNSQIIQDAIKLAEESDCKKVYIPDGVYYIYSPIYVTENKTIEFYGSNRDVSELKAGAEMDYMISVKESESAYWCRTYFHDFRLNGNRPGYYEKYFDSTVRKFNKDLPALAKGGIYIPRGLVYTTVKNVKFFCIDGWALDLNDTWQINITGCETTYTTNGFYCGGNVNSISINHNEFSTMRGFCIVMNTHHANNISHNTFELIGKCAVVVCTGSGGNILNNNYFEYSSVEGVNYKTYRGKELLIHSCITVVGINSISYHDDKESYSITRPFNTSISITNNDFQENKNECDCIILTSNFIGNKITGNKVYSNTEIPILGIGKERESFEAHEVDITGNGKNPKIAIIDGTEYTNSTECNIYNITSNDAPSDRRLLGNIANQLQFTLYSGTLEEQDNKYLGFRTYKVTSSGTLFIRNSVDGIATELLENSTAEKVLPCAYYYLNRNNEWSIKRLIGKPENWRFNINITEGDTITLPVVSYLGQPLTTIEDYTPFITNESLIPPNINYKENSIVNIINNILTNKGLYKKSGRIEPIFSGTLKIRRGDNSVYNTIQVYPTGYAGVRVFENSKYYYWNGSEWINENSTIDSGDTNSRPSEPKTGESYLDLTINKVIYFNGDNWIDTLGNIV